MAEVIGGVPAVEQRSTAPAGEHQRDVSPGGRLNAAALVPWAVVLLGPVLGPLLLRAPLLNQLIYVDPWFYSGYGWSLAHNVAIFGWPYEADRFTVNLPIAVSTGLLGPIPAYFVLHYALMAGCGAFLYLAVRRYASVPVAAAAVCLLMFNPFFVRLMIWNYTTFVSLPCTVAGVALWYLGSTRTRALWTALGTGICLSAAIYANVGMGLVLPALIGVEAIAAIRGGRKDIMTLLLRGCAMAVGALLVLVVGYLGYRAYIGPFPLKDMFQATIDFLRHNNQIEAQYVVAPSIWLRTQPHIYAPVLVCVGTMAVLGRSLLTTTLRARMAQFAIAYTLVFWLYRFTVPSAVVETWYYYNMTAVTGAFAMPAILDELGRRSSRARWAVVAGVAIAVTGLTDLVIRTMSPSALSQFNAHTGLLVCVVAACCLAAVLSLVLKQDAGRLIALAVFCAIVAAIALAPDLGNGTGEFTPYGTTAELHAYRAGYNMTRLIAQYDRPASRVLLWADWEVLESGGFVNMGGHVGIPVQKGMTVELFPPMPVLNRSELDQLRDPTTTRVLAVSESIGEISKAVPALEGNGFNARLEKAGTWPGALTDGLPAGRQLYYALITLHTSK
jgi:hypothetical protein